MHTLRDTHHTKTVSCNPNMTSERIKTSIETEELQLKFWDKFTHYGVVYGLFSIPFWLFILSFLGQMDIKKDPFLIWLTLIAIIVAIGLYFFQKQKLKFKIITTNLAWEEILLIIEEVANELKWFPWIVNKDIAISKTQPSFFSGSWGEQITIIKQGNRLLVNSICDPDKRSSITSLGRNKENMQKFIDKIAAANKS